MKFEHYGSWLEAALYLKEELHNFKAAEWEAKNEKKRVLEERDVVFKNYTKYYEEAYDIPPDLVKRHLSQVKYELPNGRICYGVGMKNNVGGYELTNGRFVSKVGKQDITTLKYENENKNILIFNYTEDYLQYLAIQGVDRTREDVIILNGEEQIEKAKQYLSENNYQKIIHIGDTEKIDISRISSDIFSLNLDDVRRAKQQKI